MSEQTKVIDKNKIINGLRFAIIISLFISSLIILITIDEEAFQTIINALNIKFIFSLFLIMFFNWIFAGLRLKIMAEAIGEKLSLKDCVIIYLSGAFISHVTPFASGGGPFQVYFFHKKGVQVGKSSMIIVIQFILRLFFFGIITPLFLIFFNDLISPGIVPSYLFYLAFGVGILISAGIIVFTLVPQILNKLISTFLKINILNRFIKRSFKAKRWIVKARIELNEFRNSLTIMAQKKKALFLGAICTIIFWSLLFMIIPVILEGLGVEPHYFRAYVMQTIFYLILPYMPTPGASGIAEVGSASLFVAFIPEKLVGLVTFGWRLFTFHLVLLVGGFFALREIGKNRSQENG
ncbi:MAG: lysylphosphatidylglycerol synthase transmembrane domain-containing protein [Bacillota bacterium]